MMIMENHKFTNARVIKKGKPAMKNSFALNMVAPLCLAHENINQAKQAIGVSGRLPLFRARAFVVQLYELF
jgi:hypothetical protein